MHETGCLGLVHWDNPEGWDGEGGSRWGTHVHPWLIQVNVWQKPPQYCKLISLQLKLIKKIKLKNKVSESCSLVSNSLRPYGLCSPRNSPGQNTGVGNLSLLQGIFPIQGLNPGFPRCGQIVYQLSHMWSPRIREWVAYPFASGSSWAWNWTRDSCVVGGFFTNWAIRETV